MGHRPFFVDEELLLAGGAGELTLRPEGEGDDVVVVGLFARYYAESH